MILILIFASLACISSVMFVGDIQCNSDIETWIPLYPNAETVSVEYDFIRARSWGNTQLIQISPDETETIKQFYRDNTLRLFDEERSRGLASTSWEVVPDEDTDGSRIILNSTCGT